MEFEKINLNSLIPSDYNPRVMSESQTKKLAHNLEQFGLVDPIIINLKNNHIIGGHQRYNILLEKYGGQIEGTDQEFYLVRLGDIGWVFEDTQLTINDDNHEKALNLSLNRLDGNFDDDKVTQLLEDLQMDNFDLDLTGFEDYEIIEYSLDDVDLTLFDDDDDDSQDAVDLHGNDYTSTLIFNSRQQMDQFLNFITTLKEGNYDKTISQLLIEYLQKHVTNKSTKTESYTIHFESQKDKQLFDNLHQKLKDNNLYSTPEILGLINNDR